ncbi:hypothetical protein [Serratia marcescens]|uniref:hypothetical protein n=1 Tax=Serratia TaxID=613 RepID=UPI003BA31726
MHGSIVLAAVDGKFTVNSKAKAVFGSAVFINKREIMFTQKAHARQKNVISRWQPCRPARRVVFSPDWRSGLSVQPDAVQGHRS